MLKFLIESFRNKKNRPLSFFVNWLGLTLGFAAVIVIYIYIMQHVRHDRDVFSQNMERVYRAEMGDPQMGHIAPSGLQPFTAQMAEVEGAARVLMYQQITATEGLLNNKRMRLNTLFADSTLLTVLPFKLVAGDPAEALSAPENVIISRSAAQKLFGTEDVLGVVIKINNAHPATIKGVMEDIPESSSFSPEVICTNKMLCKVWDMSPKTLEKWGHWNSEVYIRLKEQVDVNSFEQKFSQGVKAEIENAWGGEYKSKIGINSFQDCYFDSTSGYSHAKSVSLSSLYIMGVIAVLILVIAIINYVNIYTARTTEVIRAIGIKSILGASRAGLIAYIIFDSTLLTFLAAIGAFLIALPFQPLYALLFSETINFSVTPDTLAILFILLPALSGVLCGIFPAIALTRMKPLDAIANRNSGGKQMSAVRNSLIVFQFSITIALIASTLFINKQMSYMRGLDLGYNRENVVNISGENFIGGKIESFRNKLLTNPNVLDVCLMKSNPINVGEFMTLSWGEGEENSTSPLIMWSDERFLPFMGIQLVEGKEFDAAAIKSGEGAYLINETFANIIRTQIPDVQFPFTVDKTTYLGVFKDYQNRELTQQISPMAYGSAWRWGDENPYGNAYVKISGNDLEATLQFIERNFNELYPNQLFEWSFLDEQFDNLYKDSKMFQARLLAFSVLAIFIGCLGLFALVSYSVERRRKEIAVRKVYGSTISEILALLSMSFLRWILLSFVIAVPIIWWGMNTWVEQYVYRTVLSWWIFGVAILATLVVAVITIVGQSYHAASQNPANYLKGE